MDNSEFNLTIIRLAAIFYIGWIMMSTKPAKQKTAGLHVGGDRILHLSCHDYRHL